MGTGDFERSYIRGATDLHSDGSTKQVGYVKDILDTITTRIEKSCHGTGDVYASACTGARVRGRLRFEAAKIAVDYTVLCIENTQDDPDHWYGVKFEPVLPELIRIF